MIVTATAERWADPAPMPMAVGMRPATIESVVIRIGRRRTWLAWRMACRRGTPSASSLLV